MQQISLLDIISSLNCMNHPMLAPSRSANVSSRKPFGKQAGLVSVLAPLALAGSTLCFAANPARAITSFAGNYDPANWTQSVQGNGSIDTSNAPVSIMLNGPDDGSGNAQNVDFTIAAPAAGTVLFNWVYSTDDDAPDQDPFGFVLNGSFIQLSSDTGASYQSETAAFTVIAGDDFWLQTESC